MDDGEVSLSGEFSEESSFSGISPVRNVPTAQPLSDQLQLDLCELDLNGKRLELDLKDVEINIETASRAKEREPEPIPIFSCIYCTNEYLVFSHASNKLLATKYEHLAFLKDSLQKSPDDLLSLSEVRATPQPEFKATKAGKCKLSKSGTSISNMKRYQRYLTNKESKLNQIKSKLKPLLNNSTKDPPTQHVPDKNMHWMLQRFYLSRKNRPKLSFLIEQSISLAPNPPQRSFQKQIPLLASNKCFKSSCLQSLEASLASSKPLEDLNFSVTVHDIYVPVFDASLSGELILEEVGKKEVKPLGEIDCGRHKQSSSISSVNLLINSKKPPLQMNVLRKKCHSKVPKKSLEQKTQRVLAKTMKDEPEIEIERIKESSNCRSLIAKNRDGVPIQIMITSVIERRKPRTSIGKVKRTDFNNTQRVSLQGGKKAESRAEVPRHLKSDVISPKNGLPFKSSRANYNKPA